MTPGRPTVRSGLRDPGHPETRVLMWRLDYPDAKGRIWFGALEDGTVFQRIGEQRWATMLTGPLSIDDSFELAVEMTRQHDGRMVMTGPVEFAIEESLAANIRLDVMWDSAEMILMIGFDMALKASSARPGR
jgi:hypothetical protein